MEQVTEMFSHATSVWINLEPSFVDWNNWLQTSLCNILKGALPDSPCQPDSVSNEQLRGTFCVSVVQELS